MTFNKCELQRFQFATIFWAFLIFITPALADHPGGKIDEYMEQQEKYFQAMDIANAPEFSLIDVDGAKVSLSDFKDKVVILNFIFTSCTDSCPIHTAVMADIQEKINITPMKDNVQIISITTDPEKDTGEVLKRYSEKFNIDPVNWKFLTIPSGAAESTTRDLSSAYNVKFEPMKDGQQMHGAVTHIIDRNGRFAGKFHGLEFSPVNVVLYVNGLINNWYTNDDHHSKSIWETIKDFLSL